jgi:hypothetical protein
VLDERTLLDFNATVPPDLIRSCILTGTRMRCWTRRRSGGTPGFATRCVQLQLPAAEPVGRTAVVGPDDQDPARPAKVVGVGKVIDPAGVTWRVSRRWYPWRRNLSLRDLLTTSPTVQDEAVQDEVVESTAEPDLPRNSVLKVLFLLLGVVVWIVVGLGKIVFHTGVVALFLVASLVELALALLVMPVAMGLRLAGMARWPVEIGRGGKHFATDYAGDFAAAGALRDRVSAEIAAGEVQTQP